MGDLYGIDGKKLSSEPVIERVRPEIPMDTPEGKFIVPVVLLAQGQYAQLVDDIVQRIVDTLVPEQLELPFEEEPVILEACPTTSPSPSTPSQPSQPPSRRSSATSTTKPPSTRTKK